MVLAKPQRVLSVDVLRGITIAFMILVNDPGDWAHVYEQLDHAEWSGWTLTDLVFPTFLFLIGVSIILSLQGRIARGAGKGRLAGRIVRRAALIFALKAILSLYPHFHWTHMRLFGVLTRIALCYLAAGLLCLATRRVWVLAAAVVVLLAGYWALMRFVPVPGFGVPTVNVPLLDHDGNLTAWIDRGFNAWTQAHLHTGALYRKTNDPEGLLSTLPAIATTLLGAITGVVMRREEWTRGRRCAIFAGVGALMVAGGELWSRTLPINKNLWTSSYVLLAAGLSLLGLALFYWLIDVTRVTERSLGQGGALALAGLWVERDRGVLRVGFYRRDDGLDQGAGRRPEGDLVELGLCAWLFAWALDGGDVGLFCAGVCGGVLCAELAALAQTNLRQDLRRLSPGVGAGAAAVTMRVAAFRRGGGG